MVMMIQVDRLVRLISWVGEYGERISLNTAMFAFRKRVGVDIAVPIVVGVREDEIVAFITFF